jgi:uncharacterized protein YfaP (DUF2135 family)
MATVSAAQDAHGPHAARRRRIRQHRARFRAAGALPASNVSTEGRSARALIAGRITHELASRDRAVMRLVIDSVALPLDAADGPSRLVVRPRRARRVGARRGRRGRAGAVRRGQPNRLAPKLRVVLSWDTDDRPRSACRLGRQPHVCRRAGGAQRRALDVDVTTGFGPEIYAQATARRVPHHVNYYGAGEQRDDHRRPGVRSRTRAPRGATGFRSLRKPGELTLVRSFVLP